MSQPILSIQNVTKRYEKHLAVDSVTFDVPTGAVFGLLGPNGAGKTSLIRMITAITAPDEGQIWLDGQRVTLDRAQLIGYMPEERGLYKKMKVGEHLLYLAQLKGLSLADAKREIDYWLTRFDIRDWWTKKVEDLSKGMQQKIQFITTVVHRPKLLILDEPFSGLDPINANLIKDEIRQLNAAGTSIIFSTHRMEQVEEICGHIVLINRGQNVLCGSVAEIQQQFKENLYEIAFDGAAPEAFWAAHRAIRKDGGFAVVQLGEGEDSNQMLRDLLAADVRVRSFREILPSFNEIFIKRVGETLE